ncbi:MAG: glycosyltransferase family 4 protein, partial [Planctomycetales bacterium]|nr:glycosyltransferase family 4 protein [Planctomycetales bacterium]
CLGNFVGAKLSQEFGIPYIVEYNGSEISMKRSFDSSPYEYEALYMKAEDAAFAQASLINVISDAVRDDLVGRGVDQSKILVNPNGANPNVYSPPDDDDKALVRKSLGLDKRDVVIGFTGTFGGWHGVDVLAEALPKIFERAPNARMLLIGSGHFKYLVDDVVNLNALGDRVISVGRVPQSEGARLLRACDIFVSPHNAHMVDSRFFGSPTKIFEYMSMAGGIVASDLEQIGEVLSPALRANDVCNSNGIPNVTNERSMLCKPGDVDEFVDAVVFLCNHPEISSQLGNNARQAVLDFYSWDRHVERLWPSLRSGVKTNAGLEDLTNGMGANAAPIPPRHLDTGDDYKDEVQNQWNNDACGSHYVK